MKNEVDKNYTIEVISLKGDIKEQEEDVPSLYKVVLHNDDFTPMEFVIHVLEKFFYMDRARAIKITMEAHLKGKAMFGRFTQDIAVTKISEVMDYAKLEEHPLRCSTEAM